MAASSLIRTVRTRLARQRKRLREAFAQEPPSANPLLLGGVAAVATGLPLIVLSSTSGLQILGSTLTGAGVACGLASASLRFSARTQARERHEREREASATLATHLYGRHDHRREYLGGSRLKQRIDLSGHDFGEAVLDRVDWREVDLNGCNFKQASLVAARLTYCSASEADFELARMDGCRLDIFAPRASFKGTQCAGANFSGCLLDRSSFGRLPDRPTHLRGASFSGSSGLDEVDFEGAYAEGVLFDDATLYGTKLTEAFLAGARFDRAKLYGVDLRGAMLAGGQGDRPARFDQADLGTELLGMDGHRTDFAEAWIVGLDFSGATGIEAASFRGAIADASTRFPAGCDPAALGVVLLHELSAGEAAETVDGWVEKHARPMGWLD